MCDRALHGRTFDGASFRCYGASETTMPCVVEYGNIRVSRSQPDQSRQVSETFQLQGTVSRVKRR